MSQALSAFIGFVVCSSVAGYGYVSGQPMGAGMGGSGLGMPMDWPGMPAAQQRVRLLNEACTGAGECVMAYSTCSNGKCACLNGFADSNGICEPQVATCSFGEPLRMGNGGALVKCARRWKPATPPPQGQQPGQPQVQAMSMGPGVVRGVGVASMPAVEDTCHRPDYECNMPSSAMTGVLHPTDTSAPGICCPVSKTRDQCPIGLPETNYTCSPHIETTKQYCPVASHFCHYPMSSLSYGGAVPAGVCCPSMCPQSYGPPLSYVNGKCLRTGLQIGDACEANVQCSFPGQVPTADERKTPACLEGKCACPPGYEVERPSMYGGMYGGMGGGMMPMGGMGGPMMGRKRRQAGPGMGYGGIGYGGSGMCVLPSMQPRNDPTGGDYHQQGPGARGPSMSGMSPMSMAPQMPPMPAMPVMPAMPAMPQPNPSMVGQPAKKGNAPQPQMPKTSNAKPFTNGFPPQQYSYGK